MEYTDQSQSKVTTELTQTTALDSQSPSIHIDQGMCYIHFAYDIGLSIDLNEAEQRITTTKQRETIKHKRRAPQYFEYNPPPLRVTQDIEPLVLAGYPTTTTVDTMIFDFGAVSVAYCIPISGPMNRLLALSEELYGNKLLKTDSRMKVEQLLTTIEPAVNKPKISALVEDYTIYQIEALRPVTDLNHILTHNSPLLAQILRAETGPLSEQEVKEALACHISFGEHDMVIVDWNATLLFDSVADDVRAVLEFANVELLEMRYLDDQLDNALDETYKISSRQQWGRQMFFGSSTSELRRIAELQADSAILFEGVNNAIKLLGDQYLARVYSSASQRLHLNDWDTNIIRKLKTVDSIYYKISSHQATQRLELLEWIIIVLIAVSTAISIMPH